ncbi:lymphocyte antigen 6L [Sciurus carolinensis]|uniref:lymphocyte antigen 6L n=1 Tax=Sciurus carolinensis TaxID=30640 RepID=UPI001FB3E73A|nr:lymphocyte antigen 6L [Sciurus carolinensis]
MGRLVLALWATLMSADLAGVPTIPGQGAETATGATSAPSAHSSALLPTTQNLSCFQCFKVNSWSLCKPAVCPATAQVCVSNEVLILRRSKVRILISKRCAVSCPNSNNEFKWSSGPGLRGSVIRRCCSGPLCNTAPAALETLWALSRQLLLQVGLGIFWAML